MSNQIVSDAFETLGGVVQQTGKQAADDAKKIGEEALRQLGLKAEPPSEEKQKEEAKQKEQQEKNVEIHKRQSAAKYKQLLGEIKKEGLKEKREIPEYIAGKPGFDKDKAVKQLETGEPPKKEKKPEPLPVNQARKKTEMFRGASG